ncbi:ring-1,2-phenylacetyl-CoA epoxidase subunit PaaC [Chitinophaga skermanii]|uniref:Ring-1,2-phenylacetyl-CoA epoxidase subunit PaaC n=1 Tax=Chitinophaga skermanii TaxID=331697 RepID=A0A327QAM2_9BACT|nr:1,2-phenylacetyl-CoA epoxidase subunit PaaC [Chitinophaga skermanii]RAJ01480.1 ring-1,2-phenylacetyl-CoA epoxidase subunit PaaC [Chitinophaga skermanii]
MLSQQAIISLLTKMGDDALIIGHRNSEWTGLGPIMEEDIAFSSMAQDKIGHAWALYRVMQEHLGGQDPDQFAFMRAEKEMRSCHFVELPIGEYDFSLMRHFLFDHAEAVRYESLENTAFEPLQPFAKKFKGEIKYHLLHADEWVLQLSRGSEESYARMQQALLHCMPLALGIFETSKAHEQTLIDEKIYPGEQALQARWLDRIYPVLSKAGLNLPGIESFTPVYGGREGYHTAYLQPLLDEMSSVFKLDPTATW